MKKCVISIFCLPYEIDMLERTLVQLKRSVPYLNDSVEFTLDVKISFGDELVDWKNSKLDVEFFRSKFYSLRKYGEGFKECKFSEGYKNSINGCVSNRRTTLDVYNDYDFFIWLDTDIIFDERTLSYFQTAMDSLDETHAHFVITPEIVRIWDTTWDCLVNDNYKNKPLNFHKTCDPYTESGITGTVELAPMMNVAPNPPMKFAGGWFTCISGDLLRLIGVPQSFGHYGLEDTFIMFGSHILNQKGYDIEQFKLKNVIVCEDYMYRQNDHYINGLELIDRREEYKKVAESNFNMELGKL